jgi:hypothetical protein
VERQVSIGERPARAEEMTRGLVGPFESEQAAIVVVDPKEETYSPSVRRSGLR